MRFIRSICGTLINVSKIESIGCFEDYNEIWIYTSGYYSDIDNHYTAYKYKNEKDAEDFMIKLYLYLNGFEDEDPTFTQEDYEQWKQSKNTKDKMLHLTDVD